MPRLAVSAARTVNRGTCRLGFGGLTDQFLPFKLADWSVRVHGTSCQGVEMWATRVRLLTLGPHSV